MRVLIVYQQGVLRDALCALLRQEPEIEVVGEAPDGEQALLLASRLRPDVLLTEIDLPLMDGISLINRLREAQPDVRVVVLTVHESDEMLWRALHAGAIGYIPKCASGRELVQALQSAARGDLYIHAAMIKGLILHPKPKQPPDAPGNHHLTAREKDVLRLLAMGYTNREAARVLEIGVRTVESHRAHLMEKLNMHSRAELVQYAAQVRLTPQLETVGQATM